MGKDRSRAGSRRNLCVHLCYFGRYGVPDGLPLIEVVFPSKIGRLVLFLPIRQRGYGGHRCIWAGGCVPTALDFNPSLNHDDRKASKDINEQANIRTTRT